MKNTMEPDTCTSNHTMLDVLRRNATLHSQKRAVVSGRRSITWGELNTRSDQVANGLVELGCRPGDRVGILSENSIEYILAIIGTLKAGGCIVLLSTMSTAETIEKMIKDSGANTLFASDSSYSQFRALFECPKRQFRGERVSLDVSREGWHRISGFTSLNPSTETPIAIDSEMDCTIIYSSGTTGEPKGIVHTHAIRNVLCEILSLHDVAAAERKTVVSTPLSANWGLVGALSTLWAGGVVLLMTKFTVNDFLTLCSTENPTDAFLVPTQLVRILSSNNFAEHVRETSTTKFVAGSPLSADKKREVMARWPGPLIEIYGATEGGASTTLLADRYPDKVDSVGRASEGVVIKVIDDEDNEIPGNGVGEIVGRSSAMMRGYTRCEAANDDLIWTDTAGQVFFRSGDLGYIDSDGFLYLCGRKKDMIISGGLNIYPSDIESVLSKHEAVSEAVVIGIPSEQWGESPFGLVTLEGEATCTTTEIVEWANERLAKHQRLLNVEIREDFPRGALGKVLKRELRKPYWEHA